MTDMQIGYNFSYRALQLLDAGVDPKDVVNQLASVAEDLYTQIVELKTATAAPKIVQRTSK